MAEPNVRVDGKRLREFAGLLASTTNDFRRCAEMLDGSLSRLGSSWRDQQFLDFANEVKHVRSVIEEFANEATTAQREIVGDAERAETYERVVSR